MYLLIPLFYARLLYQIYNLHSTMYLLIRATPAVNTTAFSKFTFHYVSINSFSIMLINLSE